MNNRGKEMPLPVTNSGPRPGDFDIGSPKSKAAARLLIEKRKQSTSYTHIHYGTGDFSEQCEHCKRNEHGPNDITITINNIDNLDEPGEPVALDEQARPEAEASPPIPQQEQIAVDASQELETKPAPCTDIQLEDDEAAREARLKAYMASRRPLVRPRPRRFRWPPSAYGL